ncbi:MAG: hypothetical protein FWC32_01680, partial [Firmicutes bacterium]|nr:hypothetical protein [Bacillota bacterium]
KNCGKEIARFKHLKYAYRAAFNSTMNLLVVKSTEPWLALYCLNTMSFVRKVRTSDGTQDDGFCISHDDKYVLNLESASTKFDADDYVRPASHLVKYDCATFEVVERFFVEDRYRFSIIERHNNGYLLCGHRWNFGGLLWSSEQRITPIIAEFDGSEITKIHEMDDPQVFKDINPYSEIYYQY